MAEKDNTALVGALMLVAGGILGAGAALLFAPQTGKKTRRDIVRYAKKAKYRAEDVVDDLTDTVSEMAEAVSDKTTEVLDWGADLAHDAKKKVLKAIDEGQEKLEKQRARLAKLIG